MQPIKLQEQWRTSAIAGLAAVLPPVESAVAIAYETRTGALLRVDGITAGAFDREHREIVLGPSPRDRALIFEVELEALPTNGLPSGAGVAWWYLCRRSRQEPARMAAVRAVAIPQHDPGAQYKGLMLLGHSHLDVAWLWTYEQTVRKAQRTFAIAVDLLARDPAFVFVQSQPQLYAYVEGSDPELFERVRAQVRAGRFDASVAALWVESDCNIPSGESLLRQMIFAQQYCADRFGMLPAIAWLPDTFGFANTLPQLLAHAGIRYFATTKLQWNDTTKFPHPQFRWEGPDGSSVVAALIASYDGGPYPWRVLRARERNEPLVLGYGDGGGGVTAAMLAQASKLGAWIHPQSWFEQLDAQRDKLPVHRSELYLEYHRGVYTTHHDVKFHNALLERALGEAEELLSWCIAVHAPRTSIVELRLRLHAAWEIALRNQFHDVLPGTSITLVYADALREYGQAEELVASVISAAQSILPRALRHAAGLERSEPRADAGGYLFDNGLLRARLRSNGAIVELAGAGGQNLCTEANVLALYSDRPKQWEAWNIDRGYDRRMRHAHPAAARIDGGALEIDFMLGRSPASMHVALHVGEPFLRVDLQVDWRERRTLLRMENWLSIRSESVTYGSPHGTIARTARARTAAQQAQFEVPGQRFAAASDAHGDGLAIMSLDTYGWSARVLAKGGLRIGHSLLRGTSWPDRRADIGEHSLSYAFAPLAGAGAGAIERAWIRFAHEPRVRLFTCEDEAVLVLACKPAEEGEGVVVRVRECDGQSRSVRLRCGARMARAIAVDALEHPIDADLAIEGEALVFSLGAYQLRTFMIAFSDA